MDKFLTGRVAVLLPVAIDRPFDYAVPPGMRVVQGTLVRVPLRGKAPAFGAVWGPGDQAIPAARLKSIAEIVDLPPLSPVLCDFVDWVAHYTMTQPGMVLRMVLSVPAALDTPPGQTLYRLFDGVDATLLAPKRRAVIAALDRGMALSLAELRRESGAGPSVVKAMAEAGLIEAVHAPKRATRSRFDPDFARPQLSGQQESAAMALKQAVKAESFSVSLLDGVTGSGKTEVYFEAIATALETGRQALVLLPEIALSTQFLDRFQPRFGGSPSVWHSNLTPAQRRDTWRGVMEGRIRVVIGARSALFLPFPELGLIVVDEENDPSFKQEDVVIYQARDMAVVRAKLERFPVVLVSATPSLETLVNAEAGRYTHLTLPARYGGATLPEISLIDMRKEMLPRQRFLSAPLVEAVRQTVAAGEQALLFLNRRGYAPLTLCRACGNRMKCPHCTSWLVDHRARNRLICHFCGHTEHYPETCPACGTGDSFSAVGPGVERVAEELQALLPEARLVAMTSDSMEGAGVLQETLRRIARGEVDVIVGTQIIAKGHHFPKLTLVGAVDCDLGLGGGDLRAGERTYQMLQQVAGRAGRAAHPGRALLQTYVPGHPVMQALLSGDRDRFMEAEKAERRQAGMPPFARLVALIVSSEDKSAAEAAAILLGRTAPHSEEVRVLGPVPAPLSMLRDRYRYRLLLQAGRGQNVQAVVAEWLARTKIDKTVRVQIDVDPYGFL